jgi:hypothetical protein
VAEEGRRCIDHGKIHLAYQWYVRQRRSADPRESAGRSFVPDVEYLCNAAYSRLPPAEQAEWTLLE